MLPLSIDWRTNSWTLWWYSCLKLLNAQDRRHRGRKGDSDHVGPVPRPASLSLSFLHSSHRFGLGDGNLGIADEVEHWLGVRKLWQRIKSFQLVWWELWNGQETTAPRQHEFIRSRVSLTNGASVAHFQVTWGQEAIHKRQSYASRWLKIRRYAYEMRRGNVCSKKKDIIHSLTLEGGRRTVFSTSMNTEGATLWVMSS